MTDAAELIAINPSLPVFGETSKALPIHFGEFESPAYDAWDEFFGATIQNDHTRLAYERAARRFFAWLPPGLPLKNIRPGQVGRYFSEFTGVSVPTKKLHLAALRAFFDLLVERHIMQFNPAAAVRGLRYQAVEGRTHEITVEQARKLIAAIRIQANEGTAVPLAVGLRDRAIIGVMFYTAARAGAIAKLTLKSLRHSGTEHTIRFDEKGNKSREIPVRDDLQKWLSEYLAASPKSDGDTPLFRTAIRRTGKLTGTGMSGVDICRMVKRRAADAELSEEISPHSFRVATITDLLNYGLALEDVQYLAGHADPRTTRLYDRRQRRVAKNLVERISTL